MVKSWQLPLALVRGSCCWRKAAATDGQLPADDRPVGAPARQRLACSCWQCASCLSLTKAADPADEELDPAQELDGAKSILQLKKAADAAGSVVQVIRAVDITSIAALPDP